MKKYWILIVLFFAGLIVSGIQFRFTDLTYYLILVHCYILFIDKHYTYAEVPFFDWIKELFHQSRNNYDKVGHFAQGFVPALIVREMFIRLEIVKRGNWISFLTICVCISISVIYELFEWLVTVASGQSSEAFLGTQGDVWDTQSDMLFALIGALCMILFLSGIQNKAIDKIIRLSAKYPNASK